MSSPFTIRPAERGDLERIASLAGVIWRACYPGIISNEQTEYMLRRMYDLEVLRGEMGEGVAFFCACAENQLVGFASCGASGSSGDFKLHKLYVHPAWQRCGVGGALMEHSESFAREQGATALILNVNKRNEPAIGAYRKRGFVVVESVVNDIGGGFLMDDFIMRRELGGPVANPRPHSSNCSMQ